MSWSEHLRPVDRQRDGHGRTQRDRASRSAAAGRASRPCAARSVGRRPPRSGAGLGMGSNPWGAASGAFLSGPDAADGYADRIALGAYRASQRLACEGTGAAQRQPGRLGRRARLAAAADGRGRCRADAGVRGRRRPLHPEDVPGRGAERAGQCRSFRRCARSRRALRKVEPRDSAAGRRDVRVFVGRAGERRGADRLRPPARADRRHRPGARREGRRRGRGHRPRGDRRMGAGRSAQQLAFRAGDGDRHGAARPAASVGDAAGAGVAGAGALAVTAAAARIGADRDRPGRLFVAVADRPLFGDLRRDRPRPAVRKPTPGSCGWRSSAGTATRGWRRMRRLWSIGDGPLEREASRALVARAATPHRAGCRTAGGCAGADRVDARRPATTAKRRAGSSRSGGWTTALPTRAGRCWRWALPTRAGSTSASAGSTPSSAATRARARSAARCWSPGSPGSAGSTASSADRLNRRHGLAIGHRTALDEDDRPARRRSARRERAGAGRHRLSGRELRAAAVVASVPCGRGAQADRPGIYRAG